MTRKQTVLKKPSPEEGNDGVGNVRPSNHHGHITARSARGIHDSLCLLDQIQHFNRLILDAYQRWITTVLGPLIAFHTVPFLISSASYFTLSLQCHTWSICYIFEQRLSGEDATCQAYVSRCLSS